jgi:hypothetical protein
MGEPIESVIDVGHEIGFHYHFVQPDEVDCSVRWRGQTLIHAVLKTTHAHEANDIETDLVRAHCELDIDLYAGEISWTATISVIDPTRKPPTWRRIVDLEHMVLLRFDPAKGMVAGSADAHPPVMAATPWGPSGLTGSGVLRIHVADQPRSVADVGQIVKTEMFPTHPPFTFNVVACCGRGPRGILGPGVYSDPASIWFNVFFGTYQLDCNKADGWTRPFGYEAADGVTSQPLPEDLARLGKSDWNWFSNYMYGVPKSVCLQYSSIDMGAVTVTPPQTTRIGTTDWHEWTMSGIEVASCYEADAEGAAALVDNSLLSPVWRGLFGRPCPRPAFPTSFIPTTLMASMAMAYWEDDASYHTLVFGGTSGVRSDPAFLQAQMAAARATIAQSYPGAGFPSA